MFECWELLLQMWLYKFSMIFSRDLKVRGTCCGYEFLQITADGYADHYKSFEFPWSCWKLISLIVKVSLPWKLKFWNSLSLLLGITAMACCMNRWIIMFFLFPFILTCQERNNGELKSLCGRLEPFGIAILFWSNLLHSGFFFFFFF